MPEIDLAFIARQLDRVINDTGALKDDMTVVMARLDRIEAMVRGDRDELRATLAEMTAIHRRHDRLERRVERMDTERAEQAEP